MALTVSSPLQQVTYDPAELAAKRAAYAELTNMKDELIAQGVPGDSTTATVLDYRLSDIEKAIARLEAAKAGGPIILPGAPAALLDTVLDLPPALIKFAVAINELVHEVHTRNVAAGWWTDPETGLPKARNVGEMLMLTVTEVSEGMEGARKSLMDDKLAHRPMMEVELGDALIRICDLAGGAGYDLGGSVVEKIVFNGVRPDHKIEARLAPGGKMA